MAKNKKEISIRSSAAEFPDSSNRRFKVNNERAVQFRKWANIDAYIFL